MSKWNVAYRKGDAGEIEAVVDAETQEEATDKFMAGDVESVEINYWVLWRDFVEVSPAESKPS